MKPQLLTSGPIPQQIRNLAVPSSIGLFFHTMYNVVDSFYAGQISTQALAALGVCFPVFLLILATSGGLSRGSAALIANSIGSEETEKQLRYSAQCISLGILVSIIVSITGILASTPLFRFLGATGECLTLAQQYITPIFLGSIFIITSSLCSVILVASGDTRTYSKVLMAGFFTNLILDPWFLYGGLGLPAMGVAGISWATVIIQAAGSGFMLVTVVKRGLLNLRPWKQLLPDLKIYREIAHQAIPASFNILSVAIGFFVINYFIKSFGEPTVAAFGVTTRIEQIVLLPSFGLYAAIMAMVGQNNGAKKYDRIRATMRICITAGLCLVVGMTLLIYIFSRPLMGLFTDDPEVITIGLGYIRIMSLVQWALVMTSVHLAMLQAMKRPMYGFFESVLRKVILPLPLLWMFVWRYDFGVEAVWWSFAAANLFMTAITVLYAQTVLRRVGE